MEVHTAQTECHSLMRKRIQQHLLIALLSMLTLVRESSAAEDQFYFVAKTVDTSTNRQVYLRWDAFEGELPPDVVAFRLLRNGVRVDPDKDWPANTVMDVVDIAQLYDGIDQQRRKLETITRLNELASDSGQAFSASQFATILRGLIDPTNPVEDPFLGYNALWAFLGSRTDFNIARARYRAWVDVNPLPGAGSNLATYELLGVDANSPPNTVRLGEVQIDPAAQQQPLGATELRQIRMTDWACDLPENAKDQYTVMLDWKSPGADNITERVAAQAYVSGFDLYRGTENLAPGVLVAPPLDVAALASAANTDERGRPVIAGLEKVNVPLIIDSGAPAVDREWLLARQRLVEAGIAVPDIPDDKIPMEPKWLEARDQLIRAGLKPGDRRAYYLVPRDFTGQYGPTVATVVEVPLMTRPPAPWNLRTFADETSSAVDGTPDALMFIWDEVDVYNYVKFYQGTRLFCNLVEARSSGVLEYVANSESCESGNRFAVRLDVPEYRIYRFTDFDVAGRFKDSDGDGVEDSAETPDIDNNGRIDAFERSAGLQCDASAQPPGSDNYLIWPLVSSSVSLEKDSLSDPAPPNVMRLRDAVPAGNKDTVYWYRLVSQASLLPSDVHNRNEPYIGRLSHMSAPQRGLFPDREPPLEPPVDITKPGPNIDGCEIRSEPGGPWSFSETVSTEKNPGGLPFTLNCSSGTFTAADIAAAGEGDCPALLSTCGTTDPVTINFAASPNTGGKVCTLPVPDDVSFCETGSVSVLPTFEGIPVLPGELIFGGADVDIPTPEPGTCIAFFENIDGTATRVGSTCDPGGIKFTPRSGLFCGYAVTTDTNNNVSTTRQFPCTISPGNPKAPSPPQVLTFNVDNSLARFTFRLPAEQIAIALAELDYISGAGSQQRTIETIAVIDNEPGESISFSVPVEPLQGTQDKFCLSMLSLSRDDGSGTSLSSDRGPQKCFTRTSSGEDMPQYLPWPEVQGAVQGVPLQATLVENYRSVQAFPGIVLAEASGLLNDAFAGEISDCWIDASAVPEQDRQDFDTYRCLSGGLAEFRAMLDAELDFMVYRQSRVNGGSPSDWIQVSPLIEFAHFDSETIRSGDTDYRVHTLNDPFVKVARDGLGNPTTDIIVWFVDQYPMLVNANGAGSQTFEWRYQLVYFDKDQRPVKWRGSDWFGVDGL
jgi:hypothetical protein